MRLDILHDKLIAAGIPIKTVNYDETRTPKLDVVFEDSATAAQKQQARDIVIAFKQRTPKPINTLVTEIGALTNPQQQLLNRAIQAEFLRNNPDYARKLGIPLDGDSE